MFKKYAYLTLTLLLLITTIVFAFYNNHEVLIYLVLFEKLTVPLYQVIFASFVMGILLALALLLPKLFLNKRKLKKEIKKNQKLADK